MSFQTSAGSSPPPQPGGGDAALGSPLACAAAPSGCGGGADKDEVWFADAMPSPSSWQRAGAASGWVRARIAVEDTGIGISGEDQASLFRPFQQIRPQQNQNGGGSGMGLWICREVVRLHGGRVGVRSRVNEGSTFWFELPLGLAPPPGGGGSPRGGARRAAAARLQRRPRAAAAPRPAARRPRRRCRRRGKRISRPARARPARPARRARRARQRSARRARRQARRRASVRAQSASEQALHNALCKITSASAGAPGSPDGGAADGAAEGALGSPGRVARVIPEDDAPARGAVPRGPSGLTPSPLLPYRGEMPAHHPVLAGVPGRRPFEGLGALVVDDVHSNRKLTAMMLGKMGFGVDVAEDGQVAVERVAAAAQRRRPYAVVFMDRTMPNMDGIQATRRIKQLEPGAVVIGLTGNALEEDTAEMLQAGCSRVLTKPTTRAMLADAVAFLLARADDAAAADADAPAAAAAPPRPPRRRPRQARRARRRRRRGRRGRGGAARAGASDGACPSPQVVG